MAMACSDPAWKPINTGILEGVFSQRSRIFRRELKPAKLARKMGGKPVVKPGSVVDNHSSRRTVASTLKQPTRKRREPRLMLPYLALLQMGFAVPSVLPRTR